MTFEERTIFSTKFSCIFNTILAAKKAADSAKKAADKAGKEAKKAAGKAKKVKLPKGALIGAGVAVAIGLVLVILAICGVFSGGAKGGSGAEYATYIKDGEIYFTDFSKDEPKQITDRLAATTPLWSRATAACSTPTVWMEARPA